MSIPRKPTIGVSISLYTLSITLALKAHPIYWYPNTASNVTIDSKTNFDPKAAISSENEYPLYYQPRSYPNVPRSRPGSLPHRGDDVYSALYRHY
jgi:hypothetical protein